MIDRRPHHQTNRGRRRNRGNYPPAARHNVSRCGLLRFNFELSADFVANPPPSQIVEVDRAHFGQKMGQTLNFPEALTTDRADAQVGLNHGPASRVDLPARIRMKLRTGEVALLLTR